MTLHFPSPAVMGILNVTPDSFCESGRVTSPDQALFQAAQMIADGATMIDVGGEPTNPSVHPVVSLQTELDRTIPVIEALTQRFSTPISIDTSKPEVMREAITHGVSLINDVRALRYPGALEVVAKANIPVCLMHMLYPDGASIEIPKPCDNNQTLATLPDILNFFTQRIEACVSAGIHPENLILDPGIGGGNFGKTVWQNLHLLANLSALKQFNLPLLVGVSRKQFIGELLNAPIEQRLYGSLAAATVAMMNGANIIRTHDVKATVDAAKMVTAISNIHLIKAKQEISI